MSGFTFHGWKDDLNELEALTFVITTFYDLQYWLKHFKRAGEHNHRFLLAFFL
jgi:hypothetical protein